MARGIARRQRRSAWCSSPTSRPPSTGLCRGNSGGRFVDDMEPHPAGWGICALAVSLLLPPAHLPAQRLRQAAPPKGSIAAGATVQDSLVRRDVLLAAERSEERRVGKECRSRWCPRREKKERGIRQRVRM